MRTPARRDLPPRSGVSAGGDRLAQEAEIIGVRPHVDLGWLDSQRGERGADLAAVVGTVMDDLGDADAQGSVALGPVIPMARMGRRLAGS